jgi:hypothetical protein
LLARAFELRVVRVRHSSSRMFSAFFSRAVTAIPCAIRTRKQYIYKPLLELSLSLSLLSLRQSCWWLFLLHEAARRTVPAAQYTLLRSTSTYYARLYSIQLKTVKYCTTTGSRSVGTSTGSGNKIPAAAFLSCTLSFSHDPRSLCLPFTVSRTPVSCPGQSWAGAPAVSSQDRAALMRLVHYP